MVSYVCVCVCMNWCVLERHPFTAVSFSCIMTELFTYSHNFALFTDTVVHRCVCKCVCVRLCVSGCVYITLLMFYSVILHCCVLFSALWPICRLYTQKFSEFCRFPIHFLWSVIYDRRAQLWLFFLRALSLLESSPQFFCVFTLLMPHKSPSFVPFDEAVIF